MRYINRKSMIKEQPMHHGRGNAPASSLPNVPNGSRLRIAIIIHRKYTDYPTHLRRMNTLRNFFQDAAR